MVLGGRCSFSSQVPEAAPAAPAKPATPAAQAAKPRIAGHKEQGRKKTWHLYAGAAGASILAGLAYVIFVKYKGVDDFIAGIKATISSLKETPIADPSIDELQRALGPPPPDGYINVIMGMENLILKRDWSARHGWRVELRPGVKELLKALTEQGCMVTFWSDVSGAVAAETMGRIVTEFMGTPVALSQLHLGPEHCFVLKDKDSPRSGRAVERHIRYFNRDPNSILLVDVDPLSEKLNPGNTLLVKAMEDFEKETLDAEQNKRPLPVDITCNAIVALASRIRSDFQQLGRVDVPRSLAKLRREAGNAGFGTDQSGLYMYLQQEAADQVERERLRRETGLGGAVRKTVDRTGVLRGKLVPSEAAQMRPFRDPTIELGEDSILARKVREAANKLQQQQ